LLYFSAGLAPVATADPPMPFEKELANMALDAHIEKQNIPPPSVPADENRFSYRCDRRQAALHIVSRTSGAAAHGLCDNDVSKTATIISWQKGDRGPGIGDLREVLPGSARKHPR
jgi:hypothetical protein